MPSYGHAQILGFSEDVQKGVSTEAKALEDMGTDAERLLEQLEELHERTAALNAQQEELKRQLKAMTREYMEARLKLYEACSGALDTLMAAVGKHSDAARNLQRLRSRIRRPRGPSVPAPQPVPPS